jgi:hypothetical protein
MIHSHDPVHDHAHAARVAEYAERLCADSGISESHTHALVIAAWWHDVARTITDSPSFIWMPFVDDLLSAVMLWWHTVRTGTGMSVAGLAVRLIACKSIGTGAFLTRILVRKQDRILIDILHDADKLDVFNIDRMQKVLEITETALRYKMGYRVACRWFQLMHQIKVKTIAAKKYIMQLFREFIRWLKEPMIYAWHTKNFGVSWTHRNLRQLESILHRLTREAIPATI